MISLQEQLPPPNTYVFFQRKDGRLYIGQREENPLSQNKDSNCECYWKGGEYSKGKGINLETNKFPTQLLKAGV